MALLIIRLVCVFGVMQCVYERLRLKKHNFSHAGASKKIRMSWKSSFISVIQLNCTHARQTDRAQ